MVLHKYGDRLYNGVAGALRSHLAAVAARVEGAEQVGRRGTSMVCVYMSVSVTGPAHSVPGARALALQTS
jgi:hypothetical protein